MTIPVQVAILEIRVGVPTHDPAGSSQRALLVFRVNVVQQRCSDHFRRRVTEQPLARFADKNDLARLVHHEDRVEYEIDQLGIERTEIDGHIPSPFTPRRSR